MNNKINTSSVVEIVHWLLPYAHEQYRHNQPETNFIASKFVECIIGEFFFINSELYPLSIEKKYLDSHLFYQVNNKYLIVIYYSCSRSFNPDCKSIRSLSERVRDFANVSKLDPVFVHLSIENCYVGLASYFTRVLGYMHLDRKRIHSFFSKFDKGNSIIEAFKSQLNLITSKSDSRHAKDITNCPYAAEGYFMEIDNILNKLSYHSEWNYISENPDIIELTFNNRMLTDDSAVCIDIVNAFNRKIEVYISIYQFNSNNELLDPVQQILFDVTLTNFDFLFQKININEKEKTRILKVENHRWGEINGYQVISYLLDSLIQLSYIVNSSLSHLYR